jgi:hypothetical protein
MGSYETPLQIAARKLNDYEKLQLSALHCHGLCLVSDVRSRPTARWIYIARSSRCMIVRALPKIKSVPIDLNTSSNTNIAFQRRFLRVDKPDPNLLIRLLFEVEKLKLSHALDGIQSFIISQNDTTAHQYGLSQLLEKRKFYDVLQGTNDVSLNII